MRERLLPRPDSAVAQAALLNLTSRAMRIDWLRPLDA